jgi:hypothetical protein
MVWLILGALWGNRIGVVETKNAVAAYNVCSHQFPNQIEACWISLSTLNLHMLGWVSDPHF